MLIMRWIVIGYVAVGAVYAAFIAPGASLGALMITALTWPVWLLQYALVMTFCVWGHASCS